MIIEALLSCVMLGPGEAENISWAFDGVDATVDIITGKSEVSGYVWEVQESVSQYPGAIHYIVFSRVRNESTMKTVVCPRLRIRTEPIFNDS